MSTTDWSIIRNSTFLHNLRIRNMADLDDAMQSAFLKLSSTRDLVSIPLLPKTIVNCYKDQAKADWRRKRREKSHATGGRSADVPDFDEHFPVGRTPLQRDDRGVDNPSVRLERHETRRAIKRAVRAAGLATDHRCALWAWCRDRVAEFARKRGVAENTARVWAHRARRAIRPYLVAAGLGPD